MTGESLGELYVDLDLRKGQFDRKVDHSKQKISSLDGAAVGLSSTMLSLGAVGLAAAGAAMVGITKQAVTLGSELQEVDSKFEAVFKGEADSAEAWAESFGNSIGRSETELKSFLSTFQDTFVPLGFSRKEGAAMSKTLTELTTDLASFNNEQDTQTAAALQSALVGNHETMRRYGVIITQATLEQELFNMGIEDGIRGATEQEKVLARLNMIMDNTTDAQGDAARTADQFANMQRNLKGDIKDIMAEAGKPAIDELADTFKRIDTWGESGGYDRMTDFFEDVGYVSSNAASGLAEVGMAMADFYAFITPNKMDVPEGMKITGYDPTNAGKFSMGMVPSELPDLTNKTQEEIQVYYDAVHGALSEATGEIEEQNEQLERQKQIISSMTGVIPDWAGRSDYIHSRLGELGIEKGTPGDPNSEYSISSLWTPEDGNLNTDAGDASNKTINQDVTNNYQIDVTNNIEKIETSDMAEFQGTMSDGVQQAIASVGNPIRVPRDR
jgi:hypothetical protein